LPIAFSIPAFQERFRQRYGSDCAVFRAPGRVNLIGEHTDYNDGFVMPAALGFSTWVGIARTESPKLRIHSTHFNESVDLPLNGLAGPPTHHWSDYVRGVAAVLQSSGYPVCGADLLIESDVPLGAGLSSSAALEVSSALAFVWASEARVDDLELVKICQKAEHEFAGTRCGIMDQFIARFGRSGHALLLDCRTLNYELVPIPDDVRLVICNSMVKHALAGGEYNRRRQGCEEGVRTLQRSIPGIGALRDVSLADLERYKDKLSPQVYRRCHHVVTEDERTQAATAALKLCDPGKFGELMYESHRSLRDDYEVSCSELDLLVQLASQCEGVFGARMTGGGFGGCTINLVAASATEEFRMSIAKEYGEKTGISPDVYICSATDGAGRLA
jgi:galactokinase